MYDSTAAANIPVDAEMVGGYVDGRYVWSQSDWDRFPNAVKVYIAVFASTNDGNCLDVEPGGNANALESVEWVRRRRAEGVDPSVYCGSWAPGYTWVDVLNAFAAAGEQTPHIWYANYTTGPTIPPDAVAHQYATNPYFDTSVVEDFWPGVDQAPQPSDDCHANAANILTHLTDIAPHLEAIKELATY